MKYRIRPTRFCVSLRDAGLYDEESLTIEIDDYGGGEFVKIMCNVEGNGTEQAHVTLNPDEWPIVKKAISKLFKEIRKHGKVEKVEEGTNDYLCRLAKEQDERDMHIDEINEITDKLDEEEDDINYIEKEAFIRNTK